MKWIKCSDQLPSLNEEKGQPPLSSLFLIYDNEVGILIGNKYGSEGEWQCNCCYEDVFPSHWMPLPEAPKENE